MTLNSSTFNFDLYDLCNLKSKSYLFLRILDSLNLILHVDDHKDRLQNGTCYQSIRLGDTTRAEEKKEGLLDQSLNLGLKVSYRNVFFLWAEKG